MVGIAVDTGHARTQTATGAGARAKPGAAALAPSGKQLEARAVRTDFRGQAAVEILEEQADPTEPYGDQLVELATGGSG